MTFLVAPMDKVRPEGDFGEFRDQFNALQSEAVSRGKQIWRGFSFGGVRPDSKEFGITSLLAKDVLGAGTMNYVQTFSSPGSWTDIFNYSVPEDEIHAFLGFGIPEPRLIFSELRFEIGDRKLPRLNIEEAHLFEGPTAILLKQDEGEELIVDEEEDVLLRGFQERGTGQSTQRVVPLGFQLYKNQSLVISE